MVPHPEPRGAPVLVIPDGQELEAEPRSFRISQDSTMVATAMDQADVVEGVVVGGPRTTGRRTSSRPGFPPVKLRLNAISWKMKKKAMGDHDERVAAGTRSAISPSGTAIRAATRPPSGSRRKMSAAPGASSGWPGRPTVVGAGAEEHTAVPSER